MIHITLPTHLNLAIFYHILALTAENHFDYVNLVSIPTFITYISKYKQLCNSEKNYINFS